MFKKRKTWTVGTLGTTNDQSQVGRTISVQVGVRGTISLTLHNNDLTWSSGVRLDPSQLADLAVAVAQAQQMLAVRDKANGLLEAV